MKTLHLSTITVLIACAIFLIISDNAYANTCAVKETIYSAPEFFLLSDNVFVGNVTSITDYGNHQWQIHFNIEKIWKGTATRQTSTVMAPTLQACGYSITVGEKYLIYANGSPSTINPIFSKMYSDAQNDIALFDDPKFQAEEKVKEDMNKKLEVAQGTVGSMMMDKSSHMPINGVGVDQVNSTLDIVIDDERATLSVEQYTQNLKTILGDIPIKVEFGHATTSTPILHSVKDQGIAASYPLIHGSNSTSILESPLKQFKSGVVTQNIACKEGFVLAVKKQGHQPACVDPDTASKLVLRGWSENPLGNLLLKYGNQTQANLVFYDILNEPKIRDWSMKGWRYSDYVYASNGETHQSSATIHLYLPSNIGKHECENGSYGFVVIHLKPVEIEHNYTKVGCEMVTTTATKMDPESNGR
ncbi:MAG: hypothetical protein KGH87_01065 [Thaumarchaeota archaeon]|nr:hypothetical protein [Nitrososphaerota archaeon]MDE1838486.1 hypothetical protein [Nitrososphaerota archaeon]